MAAFMVLGTALGPAITGVLIDLGFDFLPQSLGNSMYFVFAAVLAALAGARAARDLPKVNADALHQSMAR